MPFFTSRPRRPCYSIRGALAKSVVRAQEVVAIVSACLAAVPICLAALVLSILRIGVMPVGTVTVMLILRLNNASGSEEDACEQREKGQSQDRVHGFAPVWRNYDFQRSSVL